jgi:hypothetical protein
MLIVANPKIAIAVMSKFVFFMFCLFLIAQTYTKLVKKVSRLGVILKFTRRESAFKSIDYQ